MWALVAAVGWAQDSAPIQVELGQVDSITFTRLVIRDDDGVLLGQAPERYRFLALDELRSAGHEVRGGEDVLFGDDDSADAVYQLGGTVVEGDCRGERCDISVEWQLYDTATESVVYVATTRGVGRSDEEDLSRAAQRSVRSALRSLLARPRFVEALAPGAGTAEADATWTGTLALGRCPDGARQLPEQIPDALPAVVGLKAGSRVGTGVVVTADGLVLTAAHVLGDATSAEVRLSNGLSLPAAMIRVDVAHDVALLDLPGDGFACVPPAEDVALGAPVFAVGNPLGETLEGSVSRGVVSGHREIDGQRLLQTDASVNPGNSGGPLLTEDGALAGLVSFKVAGVGIEGLGFAVPTAAILARLDLAWAEASEPDPAAAGGRRGPPERERVVDVDAPAAVDGVAAARSVLAPLPESPFPSRGLTIAGVASAGGGALVIVATWACYLDGAADSLEEFRELQALNALGWVALVGGTGSAVTGIASARRRPPGLIVSGTFR